MSRDDPQMKIRLPAELKARIEEASSANSRTLNAEVVHMLQSHFNQLADRAERHQEGEAGEEAVGISLGLKDPADRAAVFKSLLLQELMLLKNRISALGGKDAVLKMSKADLVKRLEGPRIDGTNEERKSYYSRIVSEMPLTAVLSSEEIEKLASRVVDLQTKSLQPVRFGGSSVVQGAPPDPSTKPTK
ncbi:MAG: Arc family DNA-binding protein [Acidovorax sp.]